MASSSSTPRREAETGFTKIDNMMAAARSKYATNKHLRPKLELQLYVPVPSPSDLDLNKRLTTSTSKTKALIVEAETQLAAPRVAPKELTYDEVSELIEGRAWDECLRMADQCNDEWWRSDQELFSEVMEAIDELDGEWVFLLHDLDPQIPRPPISPQLKNLSRVPMQVTCWVRGSKANSREHMIRDAALKPVLVTKPVHNAVESTKGKDGSVGKFLKRALSVKKR